MPATGPYYKPIQFNLYSITVPLKIPFMIFYMQCLKWGTLQIHPPVRKVLITKVQMFLN